MRVRWLIVTALAYGVVGGHLLLAQLWDEHGGLAWTRTATERLVWALVVFLVSILLLARRHPGRGGWMALHAAVAFLLGAAVAWSTVELLMLHSEHPWDNDVADFLLYCIDCARRAPIIRQTLIASGIGTVVAAGLAPLVARVVRPRTDQSRSAVPRA